MAATQQQTDTSTPEFQSALSMLRFTHQSVFLTGRAGTGKSTFLRYVRDHTKKKCVVLAPTGIAAINAGGTTLHSFFKLPFHPLVPDDPRYAGRRIRDFLRYNKEHIALLRSLELIIIDEISMVRADVIDFIDRILRTYSGNSRQPFGGKQMLLIGDVYQLEPVVKADERDILARFYPAPFFFAANVFRYMELVSIELKKVYRQSDPTFIRLLDNIRTNQLTQPDLTALNTRFTEAPSRSQLDITLCTRRDDVDHINARELERIDGDMLTFHGTIDGDFPATSLPTLLNLELKVGAQVIFVKNDQEHRWVNGTLGTITGISEQPFALIVVTDAGDEVMVEHAQWENIRYSYNEEEKKIEEEQLGVFRQFPVRLAWAITIHKSQGLTFDHCTIDLGTGTFAGGQAYVALSRCRSLEGLTLRRPLNRSDVFVRPEICQFAATFNNPQALERAMHAAQADIEYDAAARAFANEQWDDTLLHFFRAIHARYDIESPSAQRLLRRKLHTITALREERDNLKRQLQQRKKTMREFAMEYYSLGNDSWTEYRNNAAALRNYRKATQLCPELEAAHRRLGDCLDRDGQHEAAQAEWAVADSLRKKRKHQ